MAEKIVLTTPTGETIEHTPPKINARTSTKVAGTGLLALALPALAMLPYYDQINSYMLQACQSDNGPLMYLGGGAVTLVVAYVTARLTKSPLLPKAPQG